MRALTLAAVSLLACRAIPLGGDPTMPAGDAKVSPALVYSVAWAAPLVATGELVGLRGTDPLGMTENRPQETARPAIDVDTERIVVATRDGVIRCLSPIDGHIEWERRTSGRFFAGAAVSQGVVYAPGGDGVLYAIRLLSGAPVWEYHAGEELVTVPVIADGKILVASQSETVFAVDAENGKWVWQYRRDQPSGFSIRGTAGPVVRGDRVYMGFADGSLVAMGLGNGVAQWERRLSLSGGQQFLDVDSTPVFDDAGLMYAASYQDGVYALDAKSGDIVWTSSLHGVSSLILSGTLLFASGNGSVAALHTKNGAQLWTTDLSEKDSKGRGANAGRDPTMARGYLIVPTSTALAFLDPVRGAVRTAWNPGRGVSATPGQYSSHRLGSRLYVLSNLGTVFALQLHGHGS